MVEGFGAVQVRVILWNSVPCADSNEIHILERGGVSRGLLELGSSVPVLP